MILGMIVRNESFILPRTLPFSKGFKGYKLAIDFGSTDHTASILESNHWLVKQAQWPDSYATARNMLLEFGASTFYNGWMLQLDADECLFPEGFDQLEDICKTSPQNVIALARYNHARHNRFESASYPDWQARCVKLNEGIQWTLPVHEVIKTPQHFCHEPAIHHYGLCKPPRDNWLRSHNYQCIAAGDKPLAEAPSWVSDDYEQFIASLCKEHTISPFNNSHPLQGALWI